VNSPEQGNAESRRKNPDVRFRQIRPPNVGSSYRKNTELFTDACINPTVAYARRELELLANAVSLVRSKTVGVFIAVVHRDDRILERHL